MQQTVESFEPQSPLSIGVGNECVSSPTRGHASTIDCSTPITKRGSADYESNINDGLLTYSTPEIGLHQQATSLLLKTSLDYLKKAQLSAIHISSKPVSAPKPRVNFACIEELAVSSSDHSGAESLTDSGIVCSASSSSSLSFANSSYALRSLPAALPDEDDDSSDEIDVTADSKENISIKRANSESAANGKKFRTTFTEQQKRALDVYFQRNPYPDPRETEDLSQQLSLPENVIKVWFQNKRSRDKQRKFSHRAKSSNADNKSLPASSNFAQPVAYSSPLVANLQMLTSRINSYAAVAAAAAAQQQQQAQNPFGKLFF